MRAPGRRVSEIDAGTERVTARDQTVLIVAQTQICREIPERLYLVLKVEARLPAGLPPSKCERLDLQFILTGIK